jgi:Uma2 family endonuclease
MTADVFADLRNWKEFELLDGELASYRIGARASEVCGVLTAALVGWCRPLRLGRVFGSGTTYRCFPGRPDHVRRPWVSVIRADRLRREDIPSTGHLTVAPDVVGLVPTPSHSYEEVERAAGDYRSAGVKLIWVVSPKSRTVVIRRLDGTCAEAGEGGELSGEGVVPGFACKVADLFV